jgi:toxin CcdB
MAQFDVFENPNKATNQAIPYLLNVQSDLLDTLSTRVVVPLVSASAMSKAIKHLNPEFTIRTEVSQFLSPQPIKENVLNWGLP